MEDSCTCRGRNRNIALRPFKVSKSRTILLCLNCDGMVGEWIDKVYPPKKKFTNPEDLT